MGAPRIGTRVVEGTRVGVVVDHRPQGMVDVCFEDSGIVERRPATQLLAMNPATRRAALPAVRGKAAPAALPSDIYDPTQEQFRAVVQGVYETLVTKELGAKAFKDGRGARADVKALNAGKLTQEDLRALLSRAYAIATRQGQKYGYLEAGTQRPTKKGAALAAARYGADPKLVSRMLKGDAKAQKLAAAKDATKRAENRKDYEITLQLARKDQKARVTEEIVGGKLVSLRQPGAKLTRRKNVLSWEERGMVRGTADFSSKMRPFLEEARLLGKQKGQALRQLSQVRKQSAKQGLFATIGSIEDAFRTLSTRAVDALGMDALDDRGIVRSEVRRDLGVLRKTYEDIASDVQAGRPVRNPRSGDKASRARRMLGRSGHAEAVAAGREIAAQRRAKKGAGHLKGIAVVGTPYHWASVRTSQKPRYTDVTLYATPPALDPDQQGYFLISFDPNRQDVKRALNEAHGWRLVKSVTGTEYEVGEATDAPKLHKVVQYTKGGAGTRGVSGQFGKGLYSIVGPKARARDQFARKSDAEEYARSLDQKAASFIVKETHKIQRVRSRFQVVGPLAEEESLKRAEKKWENADLIYDDPREAERMASILDFKEARRGAPPITGYRTAPGISGAKAVEIFKRTLERLDANKVWYTLDASTKKLDMLAAATKRFARGESGALELLPEATSSARQRRLAEKSPELLASTLISRGEDPEKLLKLVMEAENRGKKKLANLIAKSYETEATEAAKVLATKKFGAGKVYEILHSEREKQKIKANMPGAFVQKMRAYGEEQKRGFQKEATDLEVLLAALYPDGKAPPTMLPKYTRQHFLDMEMDTLRKAAKSRLGLSEKDIEKVLTSVERRDLSRVVAEQAPSSAVALIEQGGFAAELTPAQRAALEAKRVGRAPDAKKVPRPMRTGEALERTAAARAPATLAEMEARAAELRRLLGIKS